MTLVMDLLGTRRVPMATTKERTELAQLSRRVSVRVCPYVLYGRTVRGLRQTVIG